MSDTKTYTEREAIEREREAFVDGASAVFSHYRIQPYDAGSGGWKGSRTLASERYPLPKVTRPRVVTRKVRSFKFDWRWVNERLEYADPGSDDWEEYCGLIHASNEWPTLLAILDDLRANPTEEVDA